MLTRNHKSNAALTRHLACSQSGQALIEMALVMPVVLALALGFIEMGRFAYISILIGSAARAGAAYGAQSNAQSIDTVGISNAADYDFAGTTSGTTKTNGQLVTTLTVASAVSCGCDSSGAITAAGCTTALNPTAGKCAGTARWVVIVSVTASGTFNPLFSYPGVPNPFTISKTASIPVA